MCASTRTHPPAHPPTQTHTHHPPKHTHTHARTHVYRIQGSKADFLYWTEMFYLFLLLLRQLQQAHILFFTSCCRITAPVSQQQCIAVFRVVTSRYLVDTYGCFGESLFSGFMRWQHASLPVYTASCNRRLQFLIFITFRSSKKLTFQLKRS